MDGTQRIGEVVCDSIQEENALLITAAPIGWDLAHMVMEFMDGIQGNDTLTEHEQALLDKAKEFIAKATGN